MKWSKIRSALLVSLFTLVSPLSSVYADGGTWDYLGGSWLSYIGNNTYHTSTVNSGGGNFKICVSNADGANSYELWESDPDNPDDFVDRVILNNGECHTFYNIGGYVDGTNGKAEFYVETITRDGYIDFWD